MFLIFEFTPFDFYHYYLSSISITFNNEKRDMIYYVIFTENLTSTSIMFGGKVELSRLNVE